MLLFHCIPICLEEQLCHSRSYCLRSSVSIISSFERGRERERKWSVDKNDTGQETNREIRKI